MRATGALRPGPDEARWAIESFAHEETEGEGVEFGYRVMRRAAERLLPGDRDGVFQARRERFSEAELLADANRDRTIVPPDKFLGDSLAVLGKLAGAVDAHICAESPAEYHLPAFPELSREERAPFMAEWRALRSLEVEALASTVEPLLWQFNLEYDRVGLVRPCFAVRTTSTVLKALAEDGNVFSIVVADPAAESGAEGDGTETRDGHQLRQYWNAGFVGEEPSSIAGGFNDITIALLDRGFQDQHVALRDSSLVASSRVKSRFTCDGAVTTSCSASGSTCVEDADDDLPFLNGLGHGTIDSLSDHGSTIFGVLVADLTDGQDPAVPASERDERSGHAVEAGIVLLQNGSSNTDDRCADRAESIERAAFIHTDVASHSEAHGSAGCLCTGANNGIIERVNDAFKDGLLYVKAAGNNFALGTPECPCTITSPGTAEGALTVGGIANPGVAGSQADVRSTNSFHGSSSMGGGEMGRPGNGERTIVGLSAWACVERGTECQDESSPSTQECPAAHTSDYGTEPNCGTSYATPQVAAAAAMFKDHWINQLAPSTFLNNSAQFKTAMLLMGDRWDGGTGQLTSGFHPRAGGGRLKMRMFNEAGMDAQWVLRTGSVDLYDNDVWHVAMNPSLAGFTSARRLKAVIWWYEPMTETTAADITLTVERFQNPNCSGTPTTLNGDYSYDNKKMVIVTTGVIGQCIRLRIQGNDVTANDEAGNQAVRRVNWAAYVEDTQRDDADGPLLSSPANSISVELP